MLTIFLLNQILKVKAFNDFAKSRNLHTDKSYKTFACYGFESLHAVLLSTRIESHLMGGPHRDGDVFFIEETKMGEPKKG